MTYIYVLPDLKDNMRSGRDKKKVRKINEEKIRLDNSCLENKNKKISPIYTISPKFA